MLKPRQVLRFPCLDESRSPTMSWVGYVAVRRLLPSYHARFVYHKIVKDMFDSHGRCLVCSLRICGAAKCRVVTSTFGNLNCLTRQRNCSFGSVLLPIFRLSLLDRHVLL